MNKLLKFLDNTFLDLGRQFKWSYLPPLMVYVAAGISGLTGIVGTFFVKEIKEKYSARDPRNGKLIYVPKRHKVRFRASKKFKDFINQ